MEFNRAGLIGHLNRVSCEDEITEVVLGPDLSVSALTPDQAFFVSAPPFQSDVLPEEIGVIDLSMLIKSLNKLTSGKEVGMTYEKSRLILDEGVHTLRLMTSDPDVIGTQMAEDSVEQIMGCLEACNEFPIPKKIAKGILDAQDLLGALELTLNVTKKGTQIFIGPKTGHNDVIEWPELKGDSKYALILQANAMVAALKNIDDFEDAGIILTGEDSIVGIRSGDYMYALTPTEDEG